ncbi:hypothetical protein [Paenibacillus sp. 481]|uniref:hypothetical protein n=1 Tax=Paenibacillus sp. 481 TaxID=2835869 RepID=UPI001E32F51A|nr:hypothetical protein [Paenibacillus sp. 481]UHA71878.1 hypothetical protein KIK04_14155 [Paenibacillus sp. 481]
MRTRIGCLHAHYSNIEYIEQALAAYEVELLHFVDPVLVSRVSSDDHFSLEQAQAKVHEQVEWMAQSKMDAILITCTNYIALLQEDQLTTTVPIIKIDEPFFRHVCRQEQPQLLIFTNPATVEGTMKRLYSYAAHFGKIPSIEVQVIEGAFELIMQGMKEKYRQVLSEYMGNLIKLTSELQQVPAISVAQLSMVEAASRMYEETNVRIGNPLEPLVAYMVEVLQLHER